MGRCDLRVFNKTKGIPELYLVGPGFAANGELIPAASWESGEKLVIFSSKHWLRIKLPLELDIREYSLQVGSRVDVDTKYRIKDNEWKIEFPYCASFHEISPADVNITLAPDEENEPDPDPDGSTGKN